MRAVRAVMASMAVAGASLLLPSVAGAASGSTVNVAATDDVYSIAPHVNGQGDPAVAIPLNGATTFSFAASGTLYFCGTGCYSGPGGFAGGGLHVTDPSGVLSDYNDDLDGVLVGVFTGGASKPAALTPDKASGDTINPALNQVFYVGTATQTFNVPAGATGLYLGFADACNGSGPASCYNDNSGTASVIVNAQTPPPALPESPAVVALPIIAALGAGGVIWRRRRNSNEAQPAA